GLLSGSLFDPTGRWRIDTQNYPLLPVLGLGLWGASIGDAIYNVRRNEAERPRNGILLGFGLLTGGPEEWPWRVGGSVDLVLGYGLSIGVDHVGFTSYAPERWDASVGSRIMAGYDGWKRVRPGVFGAFGVRMGRDGEATLTRIVAAPGGSLRYYVVPRYFLEVESRYELGATWEGPVFGVGFGTHLLR
nr:hypothetical protein [Deltaproteobacteria bacterium]